MRFCVTAEAEAHGGGEQPALISRGSTGRRQALLLATCALCAQQLPARANGEWSYTDPESWSRESATCGLGQRQSPVDLGTSAAVGSSGIRLEYAGRRPARVRDSGHGTMQVDFGDDAPLLLRGKQTFRLAQFHFHSPSEHAIGGERTAMEAHLVHKELSSGALAVMATLLYERQNAVPNAALAAALLHAPQPRSHDDKHAEELVDIPGGVDASALLPRSGGGLFIYSGSLTTPPCAESVTWFVNDVNLNVPPQQVLAFRRYLNAGPSGKARGGFGTNARPLQPRGGREIEHALDV
jgi:carbonic anhydrase